MMSFFKRNLSWKMSLGLVLAGATAPAASAPSAPPSDAKTVSPIKHVIVIVGENRTFDHLFATYTPVGKQKIWNLLSRGIVNSDGSPGPNYALATQYSAEVTSRSGYTASPNAKTPFAALPAPLAGGPTVPYIATVDEAGRRENGLPADYLKYLTTGGTGLKTGDVDVRIKNATTLPPGPFPIVGDLSYDSYTQSPVHRFFQMWQELDCAAGAATAENPSGCRQDLFAWVETSVGTGSNGNPAPSPFTQLSTGEGSSALGFYNVAHGDVPYLKSLADEYAMSDNFHQAIEGGTGANHIMLGTADALWFSDGKGGAEVPPTLSIENPNPQPSTNNFYTQDGYSGGSYSDCADIKQPGVAPIVNYLTKVGVPSNCEKGHYYLLNNYNPGYLGDGGLETANFTIPPSSVRNIGDALLEKGISWRYYGDQWNTYVADIQGTDPDDDYCNICNPFQYATSIMTNAEVRTTHLKDTTDLYADIEKGWLPAFAIVKPSGLVDGHPASSKLNLFEGFSKKIVDAIQAKPELWKDTAIFITFDEGGGYYDSGYVQPLDFFGDGTRIPFLVVSPFSKGGRISHQYTDHASILKFVERNWGLKPLTSRSRDNLPLPVASAGNPWVPKNGRSLGDLFDLFDFKRLDASEQIR